MDNKIEVTVEIQSDQNEWLEKMVTEYSLADSGKAMRILLDYAMQDGDPDQIFESIRCLHCG